MSNTAPLFRAEPNTCKQIIQGCASNVFFHLLDSASLTRLAITHAGVHSHKLAGTHAYAQNHIHTGTETHRYVDRERGRETERLHKFLLRKVDLMALWSNRDAYAQTATSRPTMDQYLMGPYKYAIPRLETSTVCT
jgi:hypothetical protein